MSIDYGRGVTNIDEANGIRYGVIQQNDISGDALNDVQTEGIDLGYENWKEQVRVELKGAVESVADTYGGNVKDFDFDQLMEDLEIEWNPDQSGPYRYGKDGYHLVTTDNGTVMIFKSPYYTKARFCSPCYPGAGDLGTPDEDGVDTYCLGEDWFDEHTPCPYPIYKVADRK